MTSQELLTDLSVSTREKLDALKNAGVQAPATLSEADLQQDLPVTDVPHREETTYTCVTQLNAPQSSPAAIMVGLFEQIPRWKFGSVINFATYSEGYPSPGDAIVSSFHKNTIAKK